MPLLAIVSSFVGLSTPMGIQAPGSHFAHFLILPRSRDGEGDEEGSISYRGWGKKAAGRGPTVRVLSTLQRGGEWGGGQTIYPPLAHKGGDATHLSLGVGRLCCPFRPREGNSFDLD